MEILETNTPDGAIEPMLVYLTCYKVMKKAEDSAANTVLDTAYRKLYENAEKIGNEELSYSYLNKVRFHRDIIIEWDNNH